MGSDNVGEQDKKAYGSELNCDLQSLAMGTEDVGEAVVTEDADIKW